MHNTNCNRPVYLVDGSRTPFLKAAGKPGPFAAADLAVAAGQPLLLRQPFAASDLSEVILGCVAPSADEANIARIAALRLGCGERVPAWTVQRNCASGLQALDSAAHNIASGRSELVLAGGTEAMSRSPILYNDAMVNWLAGMNRARGLAARMRQILRLRPAFFKPVIGLLRGLRDPVVGLSMGQTAENLAWRFGISRQQMDSYAVASHARLANAQDQQWLDEVEPLVDARGHTFEQDEGLRRDSTLEKLARLRPVFDRGIGNVTAGNSAQVTDGAAWLILASADAVQKHGLPVRARIIDSEWAGVDPAQMGLGPAQSMAPLLARHGLDVPDIDYWEINEAFAAQVLACIEAWKDADYCREQLAQEQPLGEIPRERLNVDGGGISLGHPVGASGARIVLHMLHILEREQAKLGVASLCIGGGQGGAMLIERTTELAT